MKITKIALLLASGRTNSNTAGLSTWLLSLARQSFPATTEITVADTSSPFFPSNVLTDATMPAQIKDPQNYLNEATRNWSNFISSSNGIMVLTPQYNWGYPGSLKNALDHLFWEWKGKSVMLATFGGHGGAKCAAQLTEVMEGGLKMKVVGKTAITLPKEYIGGDIRVKANEDGGFDGFLKEYEGVTIEALKGFHKAVIGAAGEETVEEETRN